MTNKKLTILAATATLRVLLLVCVAGSTWPDRANAATTVFTDAPTYFAAAGAQTLQDFNSPISQTNTSVTYSDMVVSCSPTDSCGAPFFATTSLISITGLSIFGSGPNPITFTLDAPVTSFGIFIAGLGTVQGAPATLTVVNSNGFVANAFVSYTAPPSHGNDFIGAVFVGLISDQQFTSVTFVDSVAGDGIFFDNAYYHPAAPVFSGTPGKTNCQGQSGSALAQQYGGLNNAAAALGYPSVSALQNAILAFCED